MTSIIPSILPSIFPSIEGSILSAFGAPSLLLDFARNAYSMGAIGSVPSDRTFDSLITFSRASSGGRINAAGEFEWVGNDVPRLTYDPVTLQPLGLLIEEQRTNLLLRSTLEGGTAGTIGSWAVAPTGWVFGAPVPAGDVSYPVTGFGTIGVRFQAVAQRPTISQIITVLANQSYACSSRITELSGDLTIIDAIWAVGFPAGATLAYQLNGVSGVPTSTPVVAGDYVVIVVTTAATAGSFTLRLGAGASTNVTCDCTMTMPQVEQASAPSSYIPTEASQVTRAADVCSVNTLSPWYNPLEGTIVIEFIRSSVAKYACFVSFEGAGSNIRLESGIGAPAQQRFLVLDSGATQAQLTAVAPGTASALCKMAGSYKSNSFAVSQNGAAALTDMSGTVPVVSSLRIGMDASTNQINGTISRITYYPRVIDVQQASA